jgi:serine/threonine-protein kinase
MKRVQHPNVIRVFESGSHQGVLYYSMELFLAGDLSDQMKELSPLKDWDWFTHLFDQLISGMKAIHDAGLIHRDIKPSNIMMNRERVVKIADFGLARHVQDEHILTTMGQVVGTPAYLSPEQVSGDPPTYAADIYAMGIVFYELLSGVRPFQECTSMPFLIQAKMQNPIPLIQTQRVEIPNTLSALVDKMIAFKMKDRYQNCADILRDLRRHA